MSRRILTAITAVTCTLVSLLGCGDGLDVNPTGEAQITLVGGSLESIGGGLAAPLIASSSLSLEMVDSINVTITEVRVLPLGDDESEEGDWISLPVVGGGEIDLMHLPGQGEPGIVVATGTLTAGRYGNVRLFFSEATITLNVEATIGSQVFEPDTSHPLTIPSGLQTGIKVPTGRFDVPAGGSDEVTIMFHDSASVRTVTLTGTGLQMNPVLTETNGN